MIRVSFWLIFIVVFLDWLSKEFVIRQSASRPSRLFQVVQNPGLIFGINLPGFFDLVFLIGGLLVFAFLYQQILVNKKAAEAFALIIGGAVANILDRLLDGTVTDFINLGITTINFADIAIMTGIVIIISKSKNQKSKIFEF